jgi:D-alanyl-D-alanine carboxypeptidase/D-alanyl-D-alanine-endopeptidase (penicillin-binding protein 4)
LIFANEDISCLLHEPANHDNFSFKAVISQGVQLITTMKHTILSTRICTVISIMFCLAPAFSYQPPQNAQIKAQLDKIFDNPQWSNAHWGIKIVDLNTSDVLYSREEAKGFMPASNMKLYTTAAAMKELGQDFKYETRIYANGPVRNGVLHGDLLIIGSGDPSISGRYSPDTSTTTLLKNWAKAIKAAGIHRIDGYVIGDDDVFGDDPIAGSWQIDYFQEWYAAESTGLAINDNCWDVTITPGKKAGSPAKIEALIGARHLIFKNDIITTGPAERDASDWEPDIQRALDRNEITLSGKMPINAGKIHEWGSVHNGTLWSASLVTDALEAEGVRVQRGPKDIDDLKDKDARRRLDKLKLVYTHVSLPLAKIVKMINKPSQNFYADMLQRTLGAHFYGLGTFSRGADAVSDFLTTTGVPVRGFKMVDGSGLSRQDLVEPRMTVSILQYMATQPEFKAWYDSLPIAGVDGTIRTRMKNPPLKGNVHAKTGFIGRVRSLSGYVDALNKHRIAFCMMANNYTVNTSAANIAQDQAVAILGNIGSPSAEETTSANEVTTVSEQPTSGTKSSTGETSSSLNP